MTSPHQCRTCGRTAPEDAVTCPWDGTSLEAATADDGTARTRVGMMTPSGKIPAISAASQALPAPPVADAETEMNWTDDATVVADPVLGQQLGDFIIRERLGQGGMGIVYAGEQPIIGKRVAIKVLRPEIARDPEQIQRLLSEARAVNSIRHRGIIDIFNFGQLADGRHYVVMEYLSGQPLDEIISRRGALPVAEAISILDEILAALGAGHEAGIIHRDLKPSNVFLVRQPDGSGYVKLLDFGLAKQSATPRGATPQTRTDVFVGTPEYVAPEQARAEQVGPFTDLYAAGVLAFEMLTGRLPFEANSPIDWVIQHLEKTPPAPSTFAPRVPPELDALVLRMLEKDPALRPAGADVIRRELSRLGRQLSVRTTQDGLPVDDLLGRLHADGYNFENSPPIPLTPAPHPGVAAPREGSDGSSEVDDLLPGAAGLRAGLGRSRPGFWIVAVALLLTLGIGIGAAMQNAGAEDGPDPLPAGARAQQDAERPLPAPTPEAIDPPAPPSAQGPLVVASAAAPPDAAQPTPLPVTAETVPARAATKSTASPSASRRSRDEAPNRRMLLREVTRLDERMRQRYEGEAPPPSVVALLNSYHQEATRAQSVSERKELWNKLRQFDQKFLGRR